MNFNALDFSVVVVDEEGGRIYVDEGNVEANEKGESTAAAVWAILTNEVVSWEIRRPAVALPQFGLLQAANPDIVCEKKFAKFRRRILKSVAIPVHHDERRRARGTRIGVDARHKEKEEDEGPTKGRLTH